LIVLAFGLPFLIIPNLSTPAIERIAFGFSLCRRPRDGAADSGDAIVVV
jgi:hypothetical protein